MIWIMTMARRMNGVYAAFMLVAFMMGVAGALQAPTLSLFLSREVGAQPFWIGLFYTVNAIAGIGVSLWLAKRSDSQGDRRKLIIFCCLMAIGNALLFAFNRHYLTLITCGVLLASLANTAMPQLFALAREYAEGRIQTLELDTYIDILEQCLAVLPPDVVIHRLTGDGAKRDLIAPLWSADKKRVLSAIQKRFEQDGVMQGSALRG